MRSPGRCLLNRNANLTEVGADIGLMGASSYGPTITIFATEGTPDPLIKKSM
jgi:hypothetical protein